MVNSEKKKYSTLKITDLSNFPRRYAPGIVRLTLQASSRLGGIRFQLGSLKFK
jgi:hypothetical protein